jgi:hypothetical protein
LDDHAYLGNAALDLYEATGQAKFVASARAIADQMLAHYQDAAAGGFYMTADDGEALITRTKDVFDHAVPSGGSMAAQLCLRLGGLVDASYTGPGERALQTIAPVATEDAMMLGQWVCVLDRLVRGPVEVVVVGAGDLARVDALAGAAFAAYLPNRTVAIVDPAVEASRQAASLLVEGKPAAAGGAPVAYVCRDRTCSAPIADPEELSRSLRPASG